MPLDFTLTKFRTFCTSVKQRYPTLTLAEYFQGKDLPTRFAMMCHDIERKPGNALFMARIEAESEIRATYYFRRYGSTYRPEIMKEIEGMGHEVAEFMKIFEVKTISMHGNPLTKYEDRELWKSRDFREFGLIWD